MKTDPILTILTGSAAIACALLLTNCGVGAVGYPIAGQDGKDGSNGHNSIIELSNSNPSSCAEGGTTILTALDLNDNGIIDATDTHLQSASICNGLTSALTPVKAIKPCGDTVPFKEVILRLQDGSLLSSFSDDVGGTNTRLSLLPDGNNYVDTDPSGCHFSVSTTGHVRSITWSGGGESWSIN